MDSRQREEIFREYPTNIWMGALVFFAIGIYGYIRSMQIGLVIAMGGAGLLMILLSSILVVELADSRRMLLIRRIGLFRRKVDELPVSQIQAVFVQQSRSRDNRNSPSYRVVIAMQDGQTYPLRSYYSGGALRKETAAEKIRSAIGVKGYDQTNMGMLDMGFEMLFDVFQAEEGSLDTAPEQETNGIHWQMQTIPLGATPVTRWRSKEYRYPGQFLYLAQKIEGQESGKGLMAVMGKTLFRQSMRMYGFSDADAPNLESAEQIETGYHRLDQHFLCYTSNASGAEALLSIWVSGRLVDWAAKHPLRKGKNQKDNFNQLVVLFSPNGVYLSCMGALQEGETEELINLGVELVKSQLQ